MDEFAPIYGFASVKHELAQIADFLKHPECYGDVDSRMPAGLLLDGEPGVGKTLMANCLMARSSKYFCSNLVMSASSASTCSSYSRNCSDSRSALSSGVPPLPPPPPGVPACLCRERGTVVRGGGWRVLAADPHCHVRNLTEASAWSAGITHSA